MIRTTLILIFSLTVLLGNSVKAQTCLENLYTANKLLDIGKTNECITLLMPCSKASNDESIQWQAYRLLAMAHLINGNSDSSKYYAENMLDINPTYKPNLLKDPKDFINLLNSIVVIPKFTLGIAFSVGSNLTLANIPKGYVVSDYSKTYTTSNNSFQFGTSIGFQLNPKLAMEMGILATRKKYEIDYSFSNWVVNVKEKLTYIDIPLTVKYFVNPKSKLRGYVQGGLFGGYLIYASNDFKSQNTASEQQFNLTKLNSLDRRNRFNIGLTGGIGAYYKINTGTVSVNANYYHSFSNITKTDTRYNYPEQIYTYYYVDDDIILHNLALSLGYVHNLNYKVYRTKK
jgi:hypothetical protein